LKEGGARGAMEERGGDGIGLRSAGMRFDVAAKILSEKIIRIKFRT